MEETPQSLSNRVESASAQASEDDAVIAAPVATMNSEGPSDVPAHIPEDHKSATEAEDTKTPADEEESDWGDDDSYEYEDDDDVAFSGFLAPAPVAIAPTTTATTATNTTTESAVTPNNATNTTNNNDNATAGVEQPARIEEDTVAASSRSESNDASANSATAGPPKRKWKEPTREAVNMSLRAQSETTGGKRRLAQDLYRIMNQDTEEAGFSLEPKSEDSMDKWTIKLFQFDEDSNLAKDMKVLAIDHIELEMKFPDQYPFEPPFVQVTRPRFKKQTGFVMNGALCMELLTKDGWNPVNDIESVIVSVRSLLVVGDGRLQAATNLSEARYQALLDKASNSTEKEDDTKSDDKQETKEEAQDDADTCSAKRAKLEEAKALRPVTKAEIGSYTLSEAQSAYSHLSDYHKKKGWDKSGWWARKG